MSLRREAGPETVVVWEISVSAPSMPCSVDHEAASPSGRKPGLLLLDGATSLISAITWSGESEIRAETWNH